MTSTRPGCMYGSSARAARVIASRSRAAAGSCRGAVRLPWIAAGEYSGSRRACAVMVVIEPATPTTAVARSSGTSRPASVMAARRRPPRRRSAPPWAGRSRGAVRSAGRSRCPRICAAVTPSAVPSTNSVLPPPRSTTRTWSLPGRAARCWPRRRTGRLPRRPEMTSGSTPSRSRTPSTKTWRLPGVAAGGGGHKAHRLGPVFADQGGVIRGGRERALQRFGSKLAGGVHALAEPHHAHLPDHVGEFGRAVTAVDVGDQQADGVGTAVDGSDAGHRSGFRVPAVFRTGAGRPTISGRPCGPWRLRSRDGASPSVSQAPSQ